MTERRMIQVVMLPAESVVISEVDFRYLEALEEGNKHLAFQLGMAEEGLANATQENERLVQSNLKFIEANKSLADDNLALRALLTQAPIAKVTVWEPPRLSPSVTLYAPGLPPGEHDLYLMPEVPSSGHPSGDGSVR